MGKNGQVVLVTGAAGGLGAATAFELRRRGHAVYAGVRSLSDPRLAPLEAAGVTPLSLDVRQDGAAETAIAQVCEAEGRLDTLVCNAGVAGSGVMEETPLAEFERVMDINYFGALRCMRAALPVMRARGEGLIIAISSLSALIGRPGDGPYAASKAALEAACEALSAEVDRFGLAVRLAEPGGFRTELQAKAPIAEPEHPSPYRPLTDQFRDEASSGGGADPADAAREIADLVDVPGREFRVPIGAQAREIVRTLSSMSDIQRQAFARRARNSGWWSAGENAPVK